MSSLVLPSHEELESSTCGLGSVHISTDGHYCTDDVVDSQFCITSLIRSGEAYTLRNSLGSRLSPEYKFVDYHLDTYAIAYCIKQRRPERWIELLELIRSETDIRSVELGVMRLQHHSTQSGDRTFESADALRSEFHRLIDLALIETRRA